MSKRIGGRTMAGLGNPSIAAMYRSQDLKEQIIEDMLRDWLKEERAWIGKCAEVEGAESFDAWYGDDNNVPNFGKAKDRVVLLQAHYEVLKKTHTDSFYWLEVEGQEMQKCMMIEGREGFSAWWNDPAFPTNTTPKERVELIRARIDAFLSSDGTTQIQARVREINQALVEKKATNISEIAREMADLGNKLQDIGVELSGDEGGDE